MKNMKMFLSERPSATEGEVALDKVGECAGDFPLGDDYLPSKRVGGVAHAERDCGFLSHHCGVSLQRCGVFIVGDEFAHAHAPCDAPRLKGAESSVHRCAGLDGVALHIDRACLGSCDGSAVDAHYKIASVIYHITNR